MSDGAGKARYVIAGLGVSLVGALLVIAFLLGRVSAHPEVEVVQLPAAQAAPVPAPTPVLAEAPPPADPAPPPPQAAPPPAPRAPPVASAPVAIVDTTPHPKKGTRADVLNYLANVKAAASYGPDGDGQQYAMEIANAALSGDTHEFDGLITAVRDAQSRVQAITPPDPARAYHALLLKELADSGDLAADIRTGLKRNDLGALQAASARASKLQGSLNVLNKLEADLRAGKGAGGVASDDALDTAFQ